MSFEAALFEYLSTHPLLEPLHEDRVYPIKLQNPDVLPAVTYMRVDRPVTMSHSGSSKLVHPRYQFDLYANSHEELVELTSAYRSVFEGTRSTIGTFRVSSQPAGDLEGIDEDTDQNRATLDYILWYQE